MVRNKVKKTARKKKQGKNRSDSLEMFDNVFKGRLEIEGRQAERDKAVWGKEDLTESAEMFDAVFRDDLDVDDKKEKKRARSKRKRSAPKPSELPPWKRRAAMEDKSAQGEGRGAPEKRKSRPGKGRAALLFLFMVLLAGAALHFYGLVDFEIYAEHLKGLKTEAISLYEDYAGKGQAIAKKEPRMAIKRPIPARPAPPPVVAAKKQEPSLKPQTPVEKAKPAPRTVAAVSEKKSSKTAPPTASVATRSPGKTAPRAVPAVAAKSPGKTAHRKPVLYPYSVYLGSYSKTEYFQRALSEYEGKGLSPYWVRVDLGEKGIWFRVFAGCFETEEQAEAFMKRKGIPEGESWHVKYANLIGTYPSEKAAEGQRSSLVKLGFSPYVIPDGNGRFRLHVGAFHQKPLSEALKADLATKGIQSQIVSR